MAFDFNARINNNLERKNQGIKIDTSKKEDKGFDLGKALISPFTTTFDFAEDVASGAAKTIEGIVDIGLDLLGSATSIFGSNDIEKALTQASKYDFTGNTIGKIDDWAEDSSWLSNDTWLANTVHQVGQGVGGMLPSIAVGIATGGLGTMATIAPTATFTLGAAGQSAEEALNKGANIRQATAYGALSGATEGLLEAVSPTKLFIPGAAGKLASGGLKKLAGTFVEEGVEEVLSDIITPAWEAITYSGKYETPEIKDLIQTFSVGGLTALAMGGAGKATNMAMYGKDGEKALSKYNEILELNQEEYDLETKGELTKELRDKYAKDRTKLVDEFGEQLKKLDKESKKTERLYGVMDAESATTFNSGQKLANEFSKVMKDKLGEDINIEFVNSKDFNGKYDPDKKVIYIDRNAENPYLQVLNHEFTHTLRNSGEFNNLIDSVLSTMSEQEVAKERQRLRDEYGYTENDAILNEEIAANYVSQNILTDLGKTKRIISGNKSLGRKLLDFVTDKIKMVSPNSQEYKKMKQVQSTLESILNGKEINVESTSENVPQYSRKSSLVGENFTEYGQSFSEANQLANRWAIKNNVIDGERKTFFYRDKYYVIEKNSSLDFSYEIIDEISYNNYHNILSEVEEYDRIIKGQQIEETINEIDSLYQNSSSVNGRGNIYNDLSIEHRGKSSEVQQMDKRESSRIEGASNSETNNDISSDNIKVSNENDARFARKKVTPPEGQLSLDLHTTQIVPVEEAPLTELEPEYAEYKEVGAKTGKEIADSTKSKIKTTMPRENETIAEKMKTGKEAIEEFIKNRNDYMLNMKLQFTNSFAGVEKRAEEHYTNMFKEEGLTDKELKAKVKEEMTKFKALCLKVIKSDSGANYMLKTKLYEGIWKKINEKGIDYTNDFENFLLHRLNIKRMNYKYLDPDTRKQLDKMLKDGDISQDMYDMIVEEISDIKQKPVFGADVSAEDSEKAVAELEKQHPEFKEYANEVYAYLETLMSIREAAGIVSKEQRAFMKEHYGGWYVPSYRDMEHGANTSGVSGKGKIGVTKGIYGAKGSDLDIQSIMLSMAQQTVGVHKQSMMNLLFKEMKKISPDAFEEKNIGKQTREDVDGFIEPKKNEVFFYENGKKVTYKTTDDIAIAFESLRNEKNRVLEENIVAKSLSGLVSMMKKFTTEYNPFFAFRNLFRDASDAFIYTKYSKNLLKRYKDAWKQIRGNSELWQLYLENGGEALSIFDREHGIDMRKKNFVADKISTFNEFVEALPRFSEFTESLKAKYGDNININELSQADIDVAMLDASDVTVNFARGGTFTKKMNKYLMPYLNASVQGWCKTWNTFVHPESMEAWGMAMSKVVILALPTLIFNEIFYDDDEEYQQLSDDIKGSYFLIKVGNNKFIRIPRGRVEAVVGDAMQRIYRTAKGEEDAFKGYVENTLKNVSPVDNLTRTIISPFTDVATNTTWYGGQIENRSMQALPINERYDANTSGIAKMLNKVIPTISPKKWHYLLDQYSGILGDVVLPLTSKNKDLSGISGITVNSLENNKYTDKFYKTLEEVERDRNSTNGTAVDKAKMRYLNKMNTKISELYKEKKATDDKETQTAIQTLIVKLQRDALEGVKEFEKTLKKYEYGLSQEELYDDYYREANRECFGAEVALMDHDNRVYEKAAIFNKCGINWDTFYNIYFDAQDIMPDYDADGDVVSGSKKTKITNYVKSLNLTATQKYMVMGLLGYKNTNGEQQVRSLLRSKGYNGEELNKIMKMCGYN